MNIQVIQKNIVNKYPLDEKIDCSLCCYRVANRRYVVFWQDIVNKNSIDVILNRLEQETNNSNFSEWKTLIVVGNTHDEFNKADLLHFNNVNTFVIFYLINDESKQIFMDDSWIFVLGNNYKKYVKSIDKIVKSLLYLRR